MDYAQALAYLDSFVNFERGPQNRGARALITLDRVRQLASRLGNPQDTFPSLHVAGTKGKGSTCAFAAAMLSAAGLKTGLYISPHLQDIRERIQIGGRVIPAAVFARLLTQCVPVLEEMRRPLPGQRRPTYFEVLTHLAFAWFAEEQVDVAVVEVGLGGRLDATNIIRPVACGITNISLDHVAILGETLDKIALEKAGIFKSGVPVVLAPQEPAVLAALEARARQVGAPCLLVGRDIQIEPAAAGGSSRKVSWPLPRVSAKIGAEHYEATLGLRGWHQTQNWAVALALAGIFHRKLKGVPLPAPAVAQGARQVSWPGRLEEVKQPPGTGRLILDGAHNAYSLGVILNEVVGHLTPRTPLVVLFGCAKDKDIPGMLRELGRPEVATVLFTHSGNPRATPPQELCVGWQARTGRAGEYYQECREGLAAARRAAGPEGVVLVTGSLYLVGAIKDLLMNLSRQHG